MTNQAAKQDEKLAAGLFDQYLNARLQGQEPTVDQFLAQCPASQQNELQEAIEGADVYLREYYVSHVRPSVVEKTRWGLEELRRNKAQQEDLRERASQVWDLGIGDPMGYLIRLMNIPVPAQRNGEDVDTKMRTYNRGESVAPNQNKVAMDRVLRRAKEQTIVARVEETLAEAGITNAPVDLKKIAQRLYLVVEEGPMEAEIQGSLVTDGNVGGVLINSNVRYEQRRRFTLAHEIGHFVLHRNKQTFQDTSSELRDYTTSLTEIEANIFAAMLLMPPSLLPANFGANKPLFEQADDLARRFNVSLEAALRRLIGQSNWRGAVVVSKDGVIKWVIPSPLFDGYIPSERPSHPLTMARMLLDTSGPAEDGIVLPISAWVQSGALANEDIRVHEQSRRLSSGYVYSLLTVLDED